MKVGQNKIYLYVILFVTLTSFLLKTLPIIWYNFPFTIDQGRDMLDIRNIVIGHHLTLIGPTTSINGVFLGPFYYYLNVIPFILGRGDPSYLVYWNIFLYMIAGASLWLFLKKEDIRLAFFATFIFLMAPIYFYSSRYAWSANPMPVFTIFYFLSLFNLFKRNDKKSAFILGLISGLSMQIEAAFGILFLPFALIVSLFTKRKISLLLFQIIGFSLTLIPQIVFELKHHFLMTKNFLNEVSGSSQILGDKLTFSETIYKHLLTFLEFSKGIFEINDILGYGLLILSIISLLSFLTFKKSTTISKSFILLPLFFIIFGFLFYLLYSHDLKGWYLLSLPIPLIFLVSAFFVEIITFSIKFRPFKNLHLPELIIFIFLLFIFINSIYVQNKLIPKKYAYRSNDQSTLRNELEDIDFIYQDAKGQSFKAYNYLPSVYDYPYQYLYWWYGTKTYGYQPSVVSYFEQPVPEYITGNENYFTKRKPLTDTSPIYLIIERDGAVVRSPAWRGQFTKFCSVFVKKFQWDSVVEKLENCPTKTN